MSQVWSWYLLGTASWLVHGRNRCDFLTCFVRQISTCVTASPLVFGFLCFYLVYFPFSLLFSLSRAYYFLSCALLS